MTPSVRASSGMAPFKMAPSGMAFLAGLLFSSRRYAAGAPVAGTLVGTLNTLSYLSVNRAEQVTLLLHQAADGDSAAAAQLLPLVYTELRQMAAARLRQTPPGGTLQPTALVHEAFLKLVNQQGEMPGWQGRAHFFGSAAKAMRDVLVDYARRRSAAKRGGGANRTDMDTGVEYEAAMELGDGLVPDPDEMMRLDEVLGELEAMDSRKHQIVMLRYFAGLTPEQIGFALNISERTVLRDWRFARAWLKTRVRPGNYPSGGGAESGDADDSQ